MVAGLQDSRAERRAILVIIAGLILATSVGMGIVYVKLFREAASDLTRILPDRTATWLGAELPQGKLATLAAAQLWRHPDRVAAVLTPPAGARLARPGDDTGPEDVAGLPTTLARDLLHAADRLELAWIPAATDGSTGSSLVAFLAFDDAAARRRLLARLEARAILDGRYVGYRIDAIRPPLWQRWLGAPDVAPRAVFVDPWLVLAWGDPGTLEELLAARVEGREDAIRRRPGFEALRLEAPLEAGPSRDTRLALHGAFAPALPAGWAAASDSPAFPLVALHDATLSGLGALNYVGEVSPRGELARFQGPLGEAYLPTRLALATAPGPHELIAAGPADARLAVSVTTRDLAATVSHVLALAPPRPPDALGGLVPAPLPPAVVNAIAGAGRRLGAIGLIELAWFAMPGPEGAPSWSLLVRHADPASLGSSLGDAFEAGIEPRTDGARRLALGRATRPDGVLHLLVEAAPGAGRADAGLRAHQLVWGARAGLLVVAPDLRTFDAVVAGLEGGATLGARRALELGTISAAGERALTLWLSPEALAAVARGPWRVVLNQLAPDVPFVATFSHDVESFAITTNIGPWTALAALLATPRAELETLLTAVLPEPCRPHQTALCRAFPSAIACNPFASMRTFLVDQSCDALLARGSTSPLTPSPP